MLFFYSEQKLEKKYFFPKSTELYSEIKNRRSERNEHERNQKGNLAYDDYPL